MFLLFLLDGSPLSNLNKKNTKRDFHRILWLYFFVNLRCGVLDPLRNLGKDAACHGKTSCLDAGGTLATRLNSNYACMGLPPDDMIGF